MRLNQILMELRDLDFYSEDEWEQYISHFENNQGIKNYIAENMGKRDSQTIVNRIKSTKGANPENEDKNISYKILSVRQLSDRRDGMTLGIVTGCYDLLHLVHVNGMVYAKKYLEQYSHPRLCALILSDENIRAKKGRSRPVLNINERLEMLCALECLDYVIPLKETNCLVVLENLKPDYFFKATSDIVQDIVRKEIDLVKSFGGSVVIFPASRGRRISTTGLIESINRGIND